MLNDCTYKDTQPFISCEPVILSRDIILRPQVIAIEEMGRMFFILLLQEEPVSIHGLTLAPASVAPPLEDRTG
jgi:hypothetical protein